MRAIETIYQEMLAAYAERRGGQIEEDCELAVRLWAAAAQVQALEAQADWVLAQSFPQTAAGEYLDRHAAVRGLKRQAAAKAVGALTFTAATAQTGALTVPEGTVCMTEGAVRFRTTELGTIPAGETSVTVAAEAVETGAGGNVGAGAAHVLTACPVAVTAVTNEAPFTGGLAEETDEALRVRVLDTFLRLPNGANAAWYELTACRHAGEGRGPGKRHRHGGCVCFHAGGRAGTGIADGIADGVSKEPGDRGGCERMRPHQKNGKCGGGGAVC